MPEKTKSDALRTDPRQFRVLTEYLKIGNRTIEKGQVTSDLPVESLGWLLGDGLVEVVTAATTPLPVQTDDDDTEGGDL